jgi:hypothetical protein
MANTSSTQILVDGSRNTVLKFVALLDTSNLASTLVVDIANQYKDPLDNPISTYRVDRLDYAVEDPIALNLWWGGVPTRFINLAGRGTMDLGKVYGGIPNTEATNVRNGQIYATTTGYVGGTLISLEVTLWLVKVDYIPGTGPVLAQGTDRLMLDSGAGGLFHELGDHLGVDNLI